MQAEIVNVTDLKLKTTAINQWVQKISRELQKRALVPTKKRSYVTLAFVTEPISRNLNREFRGKNFATNVLSFCPYATQSPSKDKDRLARFTDKKNSWQKDMLVDFPAKTHPTGKRFFLGELVLCVPVIVEESQKLMFPCWLQYLILHGILHLLGFEHQSEDVKKKSLKKTMTTRDKEGKMYQLQDEIFFKLVKKTDTGLIIGMVQ